MVKKNQNLDIFQSIKKSFIFYEIKWWDILGDSGHAGTK